MEKNKKRKKTLFDFILYIYFLGVIACVLLGFTIPNFKKTTVRNSPIKACYSNIRVILGAVEMYNMDHKTMISSLSDSETQNPTILNRYLKPVSHPELQCCYQGIGLGDGEGGIWCTYHGDVDGGLGKEGTYNIKQESFFDKLYWFLGRCIESIPYALAWPILCPFFIHMIFFSR